MALSPSHQDENGRTVYIDSSSGNFVYADGSAAPGPAGPADDAGPIIEPPDTTFDPTGGNADYWNDSVQNVNQLIQSLQAYLFNELISAGVAQGYAPDQMAALFGGHWTTNGVRPVIDTLLERAERNKAKTMDLATRLGENPADLARHGTDLLGGQWYVQTLEGYNEMAQAIWEFYDTKTPFELPKLGTGSKPRGRGASGPSAEDIRNSFDVDELSEAAKNIWRGMLLDDNFDPRAMARAYVDAMVAGKGKKRIDFVEFIRNKAKKTDRYASIYRNKPESMSEEQYLQPYFNAAMQVAAPGEADELAIGGAQFGADAQTFASRLRRSSAATGSAPYIQELQGRLSVLNRLFKG